MAKNLQVNLSFKADTTAALKNLETLRTSLNQISSMPFQAGKTITSDIRQAATAAEQLQHHLGMAMDVKTGNLNLGKLQSSLQSSNTTLTSLTSNLLKAGTTGQQAFLATHRAINNANLQLVQSNTLVSKFMTTLSNTLRWQVASSAINAVVSGFQSAISYAQDLNKSLNDIQIVTGYSSEKMAKFAKQANEAAKALNTTTTAYTDASLIYFQQGLGDKEVKERTDITVKLANVVGESAETVSEWTTAIWNNFAKGGEALESYADKLAALGAATASSADEIAQGLEKFSAVANTVGLSYDYATAALATVTAETRQSADIVGTAFKTLFARMEGLKLGETLEDGTTLNQYSQALESVGISIKNSNGDLKDMDIILEEMGTRWNTLSKDQQVALAQSVGGIRQYNQLIALMDNWDSFQENLMIAQTAEGTLATQATIYADSWQAAQDRIKASMEEMYNILIPEEGIINWTNGLSDIVDGFNDVLEAAGGLPTLLLGITSIVTSKMQPQIIGFFDNTISKVSSLGTNIKNFFGNPLKSLKANFVGASSIVQEAQTNRSQPMQKEIIASTQTALNMPGISESFKTQLKYQQQFENHSMTLANLQGKITAEQHTRIENSIKELQMLQDQTIELSKQKEKLDEIVQSKRQSNNLMEKNIENEFDFKTYSAKGNPTSVGLGRRLVGTAVSGPKGGERPAALKIDTLLKEIAGAKSVQVGLTDEEVQELQRVSASREKNYKDWKNSSNSPEQQKQAQENYFSDLKRQKELQAQQSYGVEATFEDVDSAIQGTQSLVDHGVDLVRITSELKQNIMDLNNAISPIDQEIAEIQRQISSEGATAEDKVAGQEKIKELEKQKEIEIQKARDNSTKIINENKEAGVLTEAEANQYKNVNNDLNDLNKASERYREIQEENLNLTESAVRAIGGSAEAYQDVVGSAKEAAKVAEEIHAQELQIDHTSKKVTDNFQALKNSFSGIGAGLTQVLQGTSQLFMSINMITSAWEQMSNEGKVSLSGISSLLMGLTMGIPALSTALGGLNNVLGVTKIAALASAFAINTDTDAKAANAIATAFGMSTEQAAIVVKTLYELKTKQITAKKAEEILATNGLAASNTMLAISEWLAATPMIVIIGLIALIVAAIVGLIVLIKALSDAYNADAIAAENAAKAAEMLSEKYEETKKAYEDLKSSIEDIKGAQEAIDDMIEGTEKWQEAVQGLNFQILELMQEYPELSKYVKNINGRLTISNEDMDNFLKAQQGKLAQDYANKTIAVNAAKTAQLKAETTEKAREFVDFDWNTLLEGFATTTAASLALAGLGIFTGGATLAPALTMASIGAPVAIGSAIGKEHNTETKVNKAISDLSDSLIKSNGTYLSSVESYDEWANRISEGNKDVKNALIENSTEIQEQARKLAENTEAISKQTAVLLGQVNADNEIYNQFKYKEIISEIYSSPEELQKRKAEITGVLAGMTNAEIAQRYAEETYGEGARVEDTYGKGFTIIDASGNKVTEEDGMAYTTAEQAIIDRYLQSYKFQKTDEASMAIHNSNIANIVSAMGSITSDESIMTSIASALYQKKELDLSNLSRKQIIELLENSQSYLAEDEYGYKTKLEEGLKKNLENSYKKTKESNQEYAGLSQTRRNAEELQNILSKTGLSKDLYDIYTTLINGEKELSETSKNATAQNLMASYAMQQLTDSYQNNLEIFKSGNAIEQAKAYEELAEGAKNLFNVEEIDTSFLIENFSLLEKAINKDTNALEELRHKMVLLQVQDQAMEANNQEIITNALNAIYNGDLEIGQSLSTVLSEETRKAIQKVIDSGQADVIEFAKWLNQYNIDLVFDENKKIDFGSSVVFDFQPDWDTSSLEEQRKDAMKSYDDEIERYHEIKKSIESVERELERLGKAKERAWGPDKLAYIKSEKEAYEEELKLQEQMIEQAKEYYEADKANILSWGAQIDENGNISNYEELMRHYVDQYNANPTDKNVQKKYEEFTNALSQYEETLTTLEEEQAGFIDLQNQIKDLAIEEIEYKVDLTIEMSEDEIKYLDYLIDAAGDNIDKLGDKVSNLTKKYEEYTKQNDAYLNGIEEVIGTTPYGMEILSMSAGELAAALKDGVLEERQIEKLKKYRDGLLETNQNLQEIADTISETIIDAFDKMGEEFDKAQTKLERLTSSIDGYNNIIEIVGKKSLGISNDALMQMNKARLEVSKTQLETAKAEMDAAEANLERVKKLAEENENDESLKKAVEEGESYLAEATENFMSKWGNALQTAADNFKYNVELIAEEFDEAVSGIYGSIENMSTAFDRQKQISELYFQDYKKVYEISKLNRQISQSLEKTDNVKAQRELNSLMSELNVYNKEGVQMSEYDLGYLQKKYELLQAQIALEESQNAKTQMTLQKDADGNWGYVYTANQDNIANAKQGYEDALYEMQDYKYQSEMALQEQYLSYIQEYKDGIVELANEYGEGSEEFKEKANELTEHYATLTGYTTEELQKFVDRGMELFHKFGAETAKAYHETLIGKMNGIYSDFTTLQKGLNDAMIASTNQVIESHTLLLQSFDSTFEDAGYDIKEFSKTYQKTTTEISNETKTIKDLISKDGTGLKDVVCNAFAEMMENISLWYDQYGNRINEIKSTNLGIVKSIQSILNAYQKLGEVAGRDYSPTTDYAEQLSNYYKQLEAEEKARKELERIKREKENGQVGGQQSSLGQDVSIRDHLDGDTWEEQNQINTGWASLFGAGKDFDSLGGNEVVFETYNREGTRMGSVNIPMGALKDENTMINFNERKLKVYYRGNGEYEEYGLKLQDLVKLYTANNSEILNAVSHYFNEDGQPGDRADNIQYALRWWGTPKLAQVLTEGNYLDDIKHIKKLLDYGMTDLVKEILGPTPLPEGFSESANKYLDWYNNKRSTNPYFSFDTGGYTGEWGPEGRLAMLHQKEIVLNASDTENLLRTIDMVRSFSDRIEQSARMTALGLSNLGGIASVHTSGDTLQQEVTIHAEFPNVSDHNEVELALRNLVNDAAQYANRK